MDTPLYGSAEHAATMSAGRHPGVQTALAWLAFSHLPEPLQDHSRPLYQAAVALITTIQVDSAELTTALNKLVESKDWFVRAGIRSDQGKPGPVPRPATVVDPPRHQGPGYLGLPNHPDFRPGLASGEEDHRPYPVRPVRDWPQA